MFKEEGNESEEIRGRREAQNIIVERRKEK